MKDIEPEVLIDFDLVSPERMDCIEYLRAGRNMNRPLEDFDDATPLQADERAGSRSYYLVSGYPYVLLQAIHND